MIDFSQFQFSPVIVFPDLYDVYDFTKGYDPERQRTYEFGVGRYDEKRAGMYTADLFEGGRDIHVGIDLAGPVGTPVRAFFEGEIFLFAYNSAVGDYGYTIITRHILNGIYLYALYGHLSASSIDGKVVGQKIRSGQIFGWLGAEYENGGWNPHLHFQLSYEQPATCDLPGVVSEEGRLEALRKYPDPRLVLGPLY